jgi:hypothetical protein
MTTEVSSYTSYVKEISFQPVCICCIARINNWHEFPLSASRYLNWMDMLSWFDRNSSQARASNEV